MSDIAHFDPFEILGISTSASELEIKKSYKKLSLVYHPDRCASRDKAGKALCETKFVMVAKAYEALTDAVAKENFQKYGNPDGRQALEMSIGLPKWLLESENQTWVIATYLLLSIIVFPASVMLLTLNAARDGDKTQKRIYPDTEEIFRVGIRNGAVFSNFFELFCLAAEFRPYVYRNEEEKKFVLELRNDLVREDRFPNPSKTFTSLLKSGLRKTEGNDKMQVLLSIHLFRLHDRLSGGAHEALLDDLEFMLSRSPVLLKQMVMHARVTCNLQVALVAIAFQQHVNQAISPSAPGFGHALLQLPHVENNDFHKFGVGILPKLGNGRERALSMDLLVNNITDKKALFDSEEKQREFDNVLAYLPFRQWGDNQIGTVRDEIKHKLSKQSKTKDIEFVFDKESFQGDLIRAVARLQKRICNNTKAKGAYAHTPFLPHDVREEWYVVLCGGPQPKAFVNITPEREFKIVQFATLEEDSTLEEMVCDLPFGTNYNNNDWMNTADFPIGVNKLQLYLFSSCYVGLELRTELTLTLLDPSKMVQYKHHEEDEQIDKEGVSLYSLLQPQAETDGHDSDFEDAPRAKGGDEDDE